MLLLGLYVCLCIQVAAEQKLAEKKYTQALRLFELSRVGFSKGLYDHNMCMFTSCSALCVQHIISFICHADVCCQLYQSVKYVFNWFSQAG